MNNDASLREYYIKLQKMYNNVQTLLSALNKSLTTSASEIEISVTDSDDAQSTVRIPSFIYLENKLEDLDSKFNTLFNMPEDGQSWMTKDGITYKLDLIRANTSPVSPLITNSNNLQASIKDNNILKDLVMPKTFIKFNLDNIPDNIEEVFMRKLIIYNENVFTSIFQNSNNGVISYEDIKSLLYNLRKGIDYDEYDSTIKMPIKKDHYKSEFKVNEVISSTVAASSNIQYKVRFNTIYYSNAENNAIEYKLTIGDIITLQNTACFYKIVDIINDDIIVIEEYKGHADITSFDENTAMIFKIYINDYSSYKYVDVPLEENQFIVVFLSTVWNNTRSILSDGIMINLNTINIVDNNGNAIVDNFGNKYSYLQYYKEYCTNIGDLILGMSTSAYPQISNFTVDELNTLSNSVDLKAIVTNSISQEGILKVVAINKHLIDDLTTEEIKNLHTQKNEINAKLQTCQSNIDQVYSTILTTDFSQNVTVTQSALQEKLQGYYTERTTLQKQLNAIVDNINSKSDSVITDSKTKYRIRGITDTTKLDSFISNYNNLNIIGIEIEYRYKSIDKDTSTLTTINGSTFTDWNRQISIDKNRHLVFTNSGYGIVFDDYSTIANQIKWNQIDIPIKYGEDVSIRVRYKYSLGQPFITLFTPWSDEYVVAFPSEFTENVEVNSIIDTNSKDLISSTFSKTLIDDGYTEHIQNKVLSNQQVFFHTPENIYSGFNTSENNLISLKDKLNQMSNDIDKYKEYVDSISNTAFDIYLNYDDNSVLLSPNSINKINIYNTEHITDMFIRKEMNIVVKNTGSTTLKLYSLFPGNTNEHLITTSLESYYINKADYERVPLYINNELDGQYLGQWIYFRQNNPYSKEDIYFNDVEQNAYDYYIMMHTPDDVTGSLIPLNFQYTFLDYIGKDNKQPLLAFRNNMYVSGFNYTTISNDETINSETTLVQYIKNITEKYLSTTNDPALSIFDNFVYDNYYRIEDNNLNGKINNNVILKYEDIIVSKTIGKSTSEKEDRYKYMYLSSTDSLSNYISGEASGENTEFGNIYYGENKFTSDKPTYDKTQISIPIKSTAQLTGGFLFPNLLSKEQLLTSGGIQDAKSIPTGGSISIPIVFEYYVESGEEANTVNKITKSLYFDIRNSLITEPLHYMLEITGNYDYTTAGDIYQDIDQAIEISNVD